MPKIRQKFDINPSLIPSTAALRDPLLEYLWKDSFVPAEGFESSDRILACLISSSAMSLPYSSFAYNLISLASIFDSQGMILVTPNILEKSLMYIAFAVMKLGFKFLASTSMSAAHFAACLISDL